MKKYMHAFNSILFFSFLSSFAHGMENFEDDSYMDLPDEMEVYELNSSSAEDFLWDDEEGKEVLETSDTQTVRVQENSPKQVKRKDSDLPFHDEIDER